MNELEKRAAAGLAHSEMSSLFMVVSAPSGTGKTSICREFLKLCPDIRFSISFTTRQPRPGEKNGVDYYFISKADFLEQVKAGAFAEWAENYGYYYGTAKEAMQNLFSADSDLLLDIEPMGAKTLRNNYSGGVFVFVLPPSLEALKSRLNRRGEIPEVMKIRLDKALDEIKEVMWYDYVIINRDLQDAVDCLRSIYRAEKCRRERLAEKIKTFFE